MLKLRIFKHPNAMHAKRAITRFNKELGVRKLLDFSKS
jgi:hypothetical protein